MKNQRPTSSTASMKRGTAWVGSYTMYSGTRTPNIVAGALTESKDGWLTSDGNQPCWVMALPP